MNLQSKGMCLWMCAGQQYSRSNFIEIRLRFRWSVNNVANIGSIAFALGILGQRETRPLLWCQRREKKIQDKLMSKLISIVWFKPVGNVFAAVWTQCLFWRIMERTNKKKILFRFFLGIKHVCEAATRQRNAVNRPGGDPSSITNLSVFQYSQ